MIDSTDSEYRPFGSGYRPGVRTMKITALVIAVVTSAVSSFPVPAADAASLVEKGELQLKLGEIDAALDTLKKAVEADPNSSLAFTRLGSAWVMKQDYAAGLESFQQAIVLNADNANAFVGMAIAYLHSGRYSLARAALEEAKRIDPSKQREAEKLIGWIDQRASAESPRPLNTGR
jgi:tetratricopeptide (TPR) repeat protein